MSVPAKNHLEGWPFVGVMTVVLLAMTILVLASLGLNVDGAGGVIRATARSSVILFCAAFTASSLVRLWKSPASRWMIRNRRYLGVSFGVSHAIHYCAVAAYAVLAPDTFFSADGGFGPEKIVPIVMLALLVATSFDRTRPQCSEDELGKRFTGPVRISSGRRFLQRMGSAPREACSIRR